MLITHNICYCNAHTAIIIFDCALSVVIILYHEISGESYLYEINRFWKIKMNLMPHVTMKITSNTSTLYANRCLHIGALIVKLSLIHFSVEPLFFMLVLIFFLN